MTDGNPAPSTKPKPIFRFTELPLTARDWMVRAWGTDMQILYSLCSKKSAHSVKRLNLKATDFHLGFGDNHNSVRPTIPGEKGVRIHITNLATSESEDSGTSPSTIVKFAQLYQDSSELPELKLTLSFKGLLNHLSQIFHCEKVVLSLGETSEVSGTFVKNALVGFNISEITILNVDEITDFHLEVLSIVPAESLHITLTNGGYKGPELDRFLGEHKYKSICLSAPTDLIDLIRMNAEHFEIHNGRMYPMEFNVYIKMWIDEEAANVKNVRSILLLYHKLRLEEEFKEQILCNLEYTELPKDQTFESPTVGFWDMYDTVDGIFEVQRKTDGKKAVIILDYIGKAYRFKFLVL